MLQRLLTKENELLLDSSCDEEVAARAISRVFVKLNGPALKFFRLRALKRAGGCSDSFTRCGCSFELLASSRTWEAGLLIGAVLLGPTW